MMAQLTKKHILTLVASVAIVSACTEGEEAAVSSEDATTAELVPATADAHMAVHEAMESGLANTFDETQLQMFEHVAHQQVVAMNCDGFEVDPARFEAEMNRIHYNADGTEMDISAEDLHELEKQALLGFGMSLGSQLTLAAMDTTSFCDAAAEERMEDDPHSIWTSAGGASAPPVDEG